MSEQISASTDQSIVVRENLVEFFKDAFTERLRHSRLKLTEITEFYLANLMHEYMQTDKAFAPDSEAGRRQPTLAQMFKEADQADIPRQVEGFKRLGDTALYISGFFPDSIQQRNVDMTYYIDMGSSAYARLAEMLQDSPKSPFRLVYTELSRKFRSVVAIMNDISEKGQMCSARDLLKLYDRWLSTGSRSIYERLVAQGLIPVGGMASLN